MICTTCKVSKDDDAFHKCRTLPGGLYTICKSCRKVSSKKYKEQYGDKIRAKWRENHKLNPDKHRSNARRYQQENWQYRKSYMRQWTKNNPDKANAHSAKRATALKKATPPWLTPEHLEEIKWFYETARDLQWLSEQRLTVDHIEPLQGAASSGLHVPWNLQIIPASENFRKGNRLEA